MQLWKTIEACVTTRLKARLQLVENIKEGDINLKEIIRKKKKTAN